MSATITCMNTEILDYLETQRVCIFATVLENNYPHAATVHFAHTTDPFCIIIQTSPDSKKAAPLVKATNTNVSLAIGTTEDASGNDKTFQLAGNAQIIDSHSTLANIYLNKFPEKQGKWQNDIFVKITPTWWRFTDWGTANGKHVIESS